MTTPGRHLPEYLLQRIARHAVEPDEHAAECPVCRARIAFFTQFNAALAREDARPRTNAERLRARLIADPSVIRLSHGRLVPGADLLPEAPPALLAAHDARPASRVATVAVYASEEHRIVVRVLHDARLHTFSLHVLAGAAGPVRGANIGIMDTDGRIVRVRTDASGIGRIDEKEAIDWPSVSVFLLRSSHDAIR